MAATAQVTVPEINTKVLVLKEAGLCVEAICRHLKVTDKEILAVLKTQGIPRLWTAKNKYDLMCQAFWRTYISNSDELMCQKYWRVNISHSVQTRFLVDILGSELDLMPMFDTLSCLWLELLKQTNAGKLIRVGLLVNGGNCSWDYRIGFEEISNVESPCSCFEISQLLSELVVCRYNSLAEPIKDTCQVLARFRAELSNQEWVALTTRFGLVDTSYCSLEELAQRLGISRARARQREAKALRTLRKSETLKDLWEPFVRLREA